VLADPPVYLRVSRETGKRLGLDETERYLGDFARRLKTHISSLESRHLVPAGCSISIGVLREPAINCMGHLGGPPLEPLEALLGVIIVSPSQRAGAVRDIDVQLDIVSGNRQ
jgi:hypothetical protein